MARRTKEDARATRDALLDAAERMFERQGVASTTLHAIAAEAGVTRGAVYWHFRDKADLFDAMMARATLPFEQICSDIERLSHDDPVGQLHELLFVGLRQTVIEPRLRCVFHIVALKVEFVGELDALRLRHLAARQQLIEQVENMLKRAQELGLVRADVEPKIAAHGLQALVTGLLHTWVMDSNSFDLVAVGSAALTAFIAGLTCPANATQIAHAGGEPVLQKSKRLTPSGVPSKHKSAL
jgi:TetR/AcrR family acrAB operon transcriptional repressor